MTERTKPSLDAALQTLVDDLIASFDEVTGEWRPCWRTAGLMPHNRVTGRDYRGVNTLLLWAEQIRRHYIAPEWAGYEQWQSIGGQVRRGERATWIVRWDVRPGENEGDKDRVTRVMLKVFNAAQIDGIETLGGASSVPSTSWFAGFEEFRQAIPYRWGIGEPCYLPVSDVVQTPPREWFDTVEQWADTLCHELGHWTGHETRLNRLHKRASDNFRESYAFEELIAEISASLTTSWAQIPGQVIRDDHTRYIKGWLKALKDDPSHLLAAAQAAQRATDHLIAYSVKDGPCADPKVNVELVSPSNPSSV